MTAVRAFDWHPVCVPCIGPSPGPPRVQFATCRIDKPSDEDDVGGPTFQEIDPDDLPTALRTRQGIDMGAAYPGKVPVPPLRGGQMNRRPSWPITPAQAPESPPTSC